MLENIILYINAPLAWLSTLILYIFIDKTYRLFKQKKFIIFYFIAIWIIGSFLSIKYYAEGIDSFVMFILLFCFSLFMYPKYSMGQHLLPVSLVFLLDIFSDIPINRFFRGLNLNTVDMALFPDYLLYEISYQTVITILSLTIILCVQHFFPRAINKIFNFKYSGYLLSSTYGIYLLYRLIYKIKIYPNDFKIYFLQDILIVFIVLIFISTVAVIWVLSRNQKMRFQQEKENLEYQFMKKYVNELDKQYQDIRKFKHDYLNILTSLNGYITNKDIEGLEKYYTKNIVPTKVLFESTTLHINNLQKIHSEEIKSLLTTKLILAQEENIHVQLELNNDIYFKEKIDIIALVRILGIFLDNSIEELKYLEKGNLSIAIFLIEKDTYIIIENTTKNDMQSLHELKKEEFSTKGKDRGLGLSNADQLIQRYPYLLWETSIEKNKFIQTLIILNDI